MSEEPKPRVRFAEPLPSERFQIIETYEFSPPMDYRGRFETWIHVMTSAGMKQARMIDRVVVTPDGEKIQL